MGQPLLDHARWLAVLTESNADLERLRQSYHFDPLDRETVLSLAHKKGDVLHDRITGERCTVLSGTRKRITQVPSTGGAERGGVPDTPA